MCWCRVKWLIVEKQCLLSHPCPREAEEPQPRGDLIKLRRQSGEKMSWELLWGFLIQGTKPDWRQIYFFKSSQHYIFIISRCFFLAESQVIFYFSRKLENAASRARQHKGRGWNTAEADSILSSGSLSLAHTMPPPAHTHLSSCSAGQQPRKAVSREPFWAGTL